MRLLCMTGIDRFEVPDSVGQKLGLRSRQKAVASGIDWALYDSNKTYWVGITSDPKRAEFFENYKFSNLFLPKTQGIPAGKMFIIVSQYEPLLSGPEKDWFSQIDTQSTAPDNLIRICGAEKEEIRRDRCGLFIDRWWDIWTDMIEMQMPLESMKELKKLPVIGDRTMHIVIPPKA
jgi:hypothetical protein